MRRSPIPVIYYCLTVVIATACGAPAAAAVGGYGFYEVIGSGDDQITVLYTGGTHYEMGYWHGFLLRDQVQANCAAAIAAAEAEGVTPEIWAWAIGSMWPYVPQDYLDEMQGLADGSEVSLEDVYKVHAIPDLSEFHCSAFAAMGSATVGGHCIQLRNLDWGLELGIQDHPVLTVYEPTGANKYVNVTFAGFLGVIAGISYAHIPVSEMGDDFDYENETLEGEPMPFLLKDVLEHAQSCTEAENMVSSAARTSSLWYTVSDPEEAKAALMMTSPTIFDVWHLGDPPGGLLPAIPDVIYGGYYNDRLYADLSSNWGQIDLQVGKAISIHNAMNSNLMNAVYDATSLEMLVAYAEGFDRAANRPYVYFDMNLPTQPVASGQATPQTAYVGQKVTFDGSASSHPNPNHAIVSYEWDWESDGTYDATGVTAYHAFSAAGTHAVTLRVTDDFIPGNTATDIVTVEVLPLPQITSFQINGGAATTQSLQVALTIVCPEAAQMRLRNGGDPWGPWLDYAETVQQWQLAPGPEGWRRVDAQCITASQVGTYAAKAFIYYDTAQGLPTGKVVIEHGDVYTESLDVTLDLYAKGATEVRLKNDYDEPWGAWEPYSLLSHEPYCEVKPWRLAEGDEGPRAVYVQYRDSYGNESAPRADTIFYDTTAPPTGSIAINGGAEFTATRAVTLSLAATGAIEMRLRNSETDPWGAWTPYARTKAWMLAAGDEGPRTVYAQFRDHLTNLSAPVSDSINLDTVDPPRGSIQINNGAEFTLNLSVTLGISATGAVRMRLKQDNEQTWGAWMGYATTVPWTLSKGQDGDRVVYVQFEDHWATRSAVRYDKIFYDSFAAPNLVYFRINDNAEKTATREVTLNIACFGAAQMRFRSRLTDAWSAWQPYANTAPWTLLYGYNGTRTVYAQCRDYLGEVSQVLSDSIILEQ
jgi:PKD repeat protein